MVEDRPSTSAAKTPIVELDDVTRILTDGPVPVTLVADIDMKVCPGEVVAVTGPSGSGKSSLIYLIGLLDEPTRGTILLDGRDEAMLVLLQALDVFDGLLDGGHD